MISRALFTQMACIWEATARKPGNVHRYADFEDASYLDFLASAAAIAPIMEQARFQPVGETILQAVEATRQVCSTNTNLGIILLIAPLAAVPDDRPLWGPDNGLEDVLDSLTVEDSRLVFEAIRLADPGGLGQAPEQDVHDEPTLPLREVMKLAAERDTIARQYAETYAQVQWADFWLQGALDRKYSLESSIVTAFLNILGTYPDTLIARKLGQEAAEEVSEYVRRNFTRHHINWFSPTDLAVVAFDTWLRTNGNRRTPSPPNPSEAGNRMLGPGLAGIDPPNPSEAGSRMLGLRPSRNSCNPGTTADLIAACLFAALREGTITLPLQIPWSD